MHRILLPLILAACGGKGAPDPKSSVPDPLSFDVEAPGPYNPGFRSWPVTYDVLGEPRSIVVNVWYPTQDLAGAEVKYAGLAVDPLAFGEAEVALPIHEGGFPVLVYSHGHQGYGGTSADLMRWFASHGWVSIAPDHVGNLLVDNPDDEEPWFDALRPMDVIAAVDSVAALPQDDPLASANLDAYVLSGHSRGCTTVWSLIGATYDATDASDYCDGCDLDHLGLFTDGSLVDPRAVAAIPMACSYNEATFGPTGFQTAAAPILSMTGTNDNGPAHVEQWNTITGLDFSWLDLEGGCHQTFALGACDTLDVAEGFWMVDTYATAFARQRLLGDSSAHTTGLLDGSIELDPRARLLVK